MSYTYVGRSGIITGIGYLAHGATVEPGESQVWRRLKDSGLLKRQPAKAVERKPTKRED